MYFFRLWGLKKNGILMRNGSVQGFQTTPPSLSSTVIAASRPILYSVLGDY